MNGYNLLKMDLKIKTSEVNKISREINDIKDLNYYKKN